MVVLRIALAYAEVAGGLNSISHTANLLGAVDGTLLVEEGWGRDSGHGLNLLSARGLAMGLWL